MLLYLAQPCTHSRFVRGEQSKVHRILGRGQNMLGMICKDRSYRRFLSYSYMYLLLSKENLFSNSSNWVDLVNSALTPTWEFRKLTVQQIRTVSLCSFLLKSHTPQTYFFENSSVLFHQGHTHTQCHSLCLNDTPVLLVS